MNAQSDKSLAGRARAHAAAALRSRAGNALLVANTLILLRVGLWYGPAGHEHGPECSLMRDSGWGDGCYLGLSGAWVFYVLANIPSYLGVQLAEWLAEPAWGGLCFVTAVKIDRALFLLVSGLQWLCYGHLCERAWAARGRERASLRVTPGAQPGPGALAPATEVVSRSVPRPAQPAPPPSIRRRSHARAVAQARSTVRGEVPSTSAASSTVRPAK